MLSTLLGTGEGAVCYIKLRDFTPEVRMTRRIIGLSLVVFTLVVMAVLATSGCQTTGTEFADPLYIKPGQDPGAIPDRYIAGIYVSPPGINIAVGGLQQFKALATWNDGAQQYITDQVEWFTDSPGVGKFEATGGRFLAQNSGVAIVRCRLRVGLDELVSQAAYVNSFNPNMDLPPAVVMNPHVTANDEGVLVGWDMNQTDGDMAGYNLWRTQVSAAHYASDYGKINVAPILYPPYLDKTVVSGWYYYRVTGEDILGINGAPSEEVAVFVTGQHHYGDGYDAGLGSSSTYADKFSTAF